MNCPLRLGVTCLLLFGARAETLDRIAVTVGKTVIAQSEVIRDLRISALLDQKPVDLSGEQKHKAADRLVDQTLILQEAEFSRIALPLEEDTMRLLAQVKAQFPSEDEYRTTLNRYKVSEEDLKQHLQSGLRAMRFTDLRFRPEVQVTADEIREFYDRMKADDPRIAPFEAARDQMEKLLTEQRVAQALDRWLGTQRNETEILYREPAFR